MAQNTANGPPPTLSVNADGSEAYYQISDDDIDECEDLNDDCLLDDGDGRVPTYNGIRGPYERAWTTDATRALIHIRGPMEGRFTEGRQKRTALWLHCTRQLQKLGYRYSAAKVQKKWHNILITYNKNLSKKYLSGYVHWEFFEEMFKYLQGKRANCDMQQHSQNAEPGQQSTLSTMPMPMPPQTSNEPICQYMGSADDEGMLQPQVQIDTKSNDEFDEDSNTMSEIKQPKLEYNIEPSSEFRLELSHPTNGYERLNAASGNGDFTRSMNNGHDDEHAEWWKDYFERKLEVERNKIQLQRDMHRELMQYNKMSLVQQEKIERIKIDAINNLTSTLQKLVEVKNRKV